MKIIIVGGGISGLSSYLAFRQTFAQDAEKFEIKIYEKYAPRAKLAASSEDDTHDLDELSSSTAIVGGGIVSNRGSRRSLFFIYVCSRNEVLDVQNRCVQHVHA